MLLLEAGGESLFLAFCSSSGCWHPLACGSITPASACVSHGRPPDPVHLSPSASLKKTRVRDPQIIQDGLVSRSLA